MSLQTAPHAPEQKMSVKTVVKLRFSAHGSFSDTMAASKSIYDTFSPTRRRVLLALVAAVYPLLPLSDTILLTQMSAIGVEMQASRAAITATMSLYLLAAGVGFMLWGPCADWLGRLLVYHAALLLFLASSVGCALAPTIFLFLAARTVQGFAASGTWSVGNAVVADIYPIEIRGVAIGIFMMPGMLGPVVAPFIGAALTEGMGWRSVMWFLAIASAVAQLAVLVIYRETQHHRVARRLEKQLQQQNLPPPAWILKLNQQDGDADASTAQTKKKRKSMSPKQLLPVLGMLLADLKILPFLLLLFNAFGCMFLLLLQLTEVLDATTALSMTQIGLCYLATGACSAAGSLLGGWAADRAAAAAGAPDTARLEGPSLVSLVLVPAGLLLVGWTEQAGWTDGGAIAAVVLGSSVACFGTSFVSPGAYSHLSQRAGEFAGAVGSLAAAGTNFWPALLLQLNPIAHPSIGVGPYNSIITAYTVALASVCCGVCLWQRQQQRGQRDSSSSSGGSSSGGSSSGGKDTEQGLKSDAVVTLQ